MAASERVAEIRDRVFVQRACQPHFKRQCGQDGQPRWPDQISQARRCRGQNPDQGAHKRKEDGAMPERARRIRRHGRQPNPTQELHGGDEGQTSAGAFAGIAGYKPYGVAARNVIGLVQGSIFRLMPRS